MEFEIVKYRKLFEDSFYVRIFSSFGFRINKNPKVLILSEGTL